MWLTLCAAKFPSFFMGGTLAPIVPPLPDVTEKPVFVRIYESSPWRGDLSLHDFLRRSNADGHPLAWIKKCHEASGSDVELPEFARRIPVSGEKIVAVEYSSKLNDRYFGQWLTMNHPFARLEDLLVPEILQRIPAKHKYLACALHHCSNYWNDVLRVRHDLELEAPQSVAHAVLRCVFSRSFVS
jgi:hypothetical protein